MKTFYDIPLSISASVQDALLCADRFSTPNDLKRNTFSETSPERCGRLLDSGEGRLAETTLKYP